MKKHNNQNIINMQIIHLSMKEWTFAWMKFKVMFLKFFKHFLQMINVISWVRLKINVINVLHLTKSKPTNIDIQVLSVHW
jgi:hypothetical protein